MQGDETRTFLMAGHCAIPMSAKSLALNVTVTQANADGHVVVFRSGQPVPTTSNVNYSSGQTRANNAIVELSLAGELSVHVGQPTGTSVHVIVDVLGYFQ
jgi:hypothetical protein